MSAIRLELSNSKASSITIQFEITILPLFMSRMNILFSYLMPKFLESKNSISVTPREGYQLNSGSF